MSYSKLQKCGLAVDNKWHFANKLARDVQPQRRISKVQTARKVHGSCTPKGSTGVQLTDSIASRLKRGKAVDGKRFSSSFPRLFPVLPC